MADSGHPPAELHERLLICRTIKLNAGALGGHRRCCHAKMQKNAQNKPQIARLILCVHTTLQFYCNLFLTFCGKLRSFRKLFAVFRTEGRKLAGVQRIADALRELVVEIEIVHHRKAQRQHLVRLE